MLYKLLFGTFLWIFCSELNADSFRCGRSLVKIGESNNALIKKCGDPVRKYSSKERLVDRGRSSMVGVSNWVYERRGKKDMIVSMRSGSVVKIEVD